MYSLLKRLAYKIFSREFLFRYESFFRSLILPLYSGNAVYCPICESSFSKFINQKNGDTLCPRCGSIPRKRLLWLYLDKELHINDKYYKTLHFSPHRYLSKKLKKMRNLQYITTDYEEDMADEQFDITAISQPDEIYDLVICYHILEHIPDDKKAMKEVYRILKPDGIAILQVPFREGKTLEDPRVTSPTERLAKFGQEDHVRYYGKDDFIQRLAAVGFEAKSIKYAQQCTEEEINRFGLNREEVMVVCRRG